MNDDKQYSSDKLSYEEAEIITKYLLNSLDVPGVTEALENGEILKAIDLAKDEEEKRRLK